MKKIVLLSFIFTSFLYIILINCLSSALEMGVIVPRDFDHFTIGYYQNKIFGPVFFSHKRHYVDYRLNCLTCHHAWKTKERPDPYKCKSCHVMSVDQMVKTKKNSTLRTALHYSCKECHENLRNEKKSTGPVKCRECHVREKGWKRTSAN